MVDFALTPEESVWRASARRFVRDHVVGRSDLDTHGVFPRDLYEKAFDEGFVTAMIPRELGGGGRTPLELVLCAEELGYGDLGVATSTLLLGLATGGVLHFGTPEQKERWVRPLTEKLRFASHAWTEPEGSANLFGRAASTTARKVEGGYRLTGTKSTISNATVASVFFTFARAVPGEGLTCLAVAADAPGITTRAPYKKLGQRASDTGEVQFDDVFVPEHDRIGREGEGAVIGLRALRTSRVGIAAMSVGVARRARDLAIQHGHSRTTGDGSKLITQQDFRFRVADIEADIEMVRALVWRAASELPDGPEATKLSSVAKLKGANMAVRVTGEVVEMLGGLGYLEESLAEKLLRDAKLLQIYEGPQAIQRMMIADTATRLSWVGR